MPKVLIPTNLNSVAAELLRDAGYTVGDEPVGNDGLLDYCRQNPDANALIVRSEKVTEEVIDTLPDLKLVVRAGAGYNTIDTKHARRKGVDVMNTPGANSNAVAEEVIALALAGFRHIVPADASTRCGKWEKKSFMGRELTGKTVGIIGLGNIGQLVIRRLAGFETRIIGFDPVISAPRAEALGVELVSLEKLFSEADVVTLHVPENDHTRGMVNRELLSLMKEGSALINCARSGVINEDDFRAVKAEKNILFLNDVYAKDAAGDKSVTDIADIMLPHLGASTQEANYNAARRAGEQTLAYFDKGVDKFVVNRGVPAGLDEHYQHLAFTLTKVARGYLGQAQPQRIETSFYGGLNEFANWLMGPVVLGLCTDFDPAFDRLDASKFLADRGITYVARDPDLGKRYGKSMTVDLFDSDGAKVSVRGTISEGLAMVTRIDGFDNLYFQPQGNSVLVVYDDQPGVLAKITAVVADQGINIDDIRCPHDAESGKSIAVLKVNQPVSDAALAQITDAVGADHAAALELA
jgi:D-3-phosphoglycerate dehydrogenase